VRRQLVVFVTMVVGVVLALSTVAHAQSASDAAADLRQNDVTFEDGAPGLTQNELNRLDNAAANLQSDEAFFKVVVLASPVDEFSSPREFAEVVLRQLGGTGRVVVFDTDRVGIASNAGDASDEIARAEEVASAETNRTQSYAEGVNAAADVLGVTGGGAGGGSGGGTGSGSESDSSSGSSTGWIWVVLIIGLLVAGGLFLWSRMKKSKAPESTVSFGEGEMKVRSQQDRAGNLVLELADRVEAPDAPPESKKLFQQGAMEFAELQDDLEQADTRPELEAVYPRIVDAVWKLESAKALVEGQPAPAKPIDEPLFPAPPPPPPMPEGGAPLGAVDVGQQYQQVPEPSGYRGMASSPWLTTAATAALSMLAGRMMAPDRSYRPPADDGMFSGGGGRRGSGRRRGGSGGSINLGGGSGGRGMGRRR
jgi:hypothetical protein